MSLAILGLALVGFDSMGQTIVGGSYQAQTISLPQTTLGLGVGTNLSSGWSESTYATNVISLWSSASAAFVNTTNIVTNTITRYADFDARGQDHVGLEFAFTYSGTSTGKFGVTIARSATGTYFDTLNRTSVEFTGNGTTQAVGVTNIDMTGFGYGRITAWTNTDAGRTLTNNSATASRFH